MDKLELLQKRRSVRTYTQEVIPEALVNKLKAEVTMINTHVSGLKFQLFINDPKPFDGFLKSYGTFENPLNYLAAAVDTGVENVAEKAGYYAEKFVISAVKEGLGTCFVGGTYDPKSVPAQLRAGEKVLFLVVFGYSADKIRMQEKWLVNFVHRKKMKPEDFFEPKEEYELALSQFPNLTQGLEAIACAPSALNKRPVRLFIKRIFDELKLCAKVSENNPKELIDLGIAKYNFNFATDTKCAWGNGAPLDAEDSDI